MSAQEISSASVRHQIIFDCDPGVDDSFALLLALASPEIDIVGITICMGNHSDLTILSANACLILQLAGKSGEIPVISGASKPLTFAYGGHSGIEVHGANGLGNVDTAAFTGSQGLDRRPMEKFKNISAAQFIVQTVMENPGLITIVAVAPLTNVALAVALGGESFVRAVKRLVIMGGSVEGLGNKTAAAEANLGNDPHAGRVVFDAFPDIVMAGLNLTHQLPMSDEFRERLKATGSIGEFCFAVSTYYVNLLASWGSSGFLHDPSAVMFLLRPEIFEGRRACVDVEEVGRLTAGQTVADWTGRWGRPLQTLVLTKVNTEEYYREFLERIRSLSDRSQPNAAVLKQAERLIELSETK